eukprot:8162074-Pyramimonas_sp.AAC.1
MRWVQRTNQPQDARIPGAFDPTVQISRGERLEAPYLWSGTSRSPRYSTHVGRSWFLRVDTARLRSRTRGSLTSRG